MSTLSIPPPPKKKNLYAYHTDCLSMYTRFPAVFDCSFEWGLRTPNLGEGEVPFERALVSSYRPSIVPFHLSLPVSEILPLLFCRTPLFPYPTCSLPKFSHVPMEVGGSPLATKSEGVGLIVCAISFQDFQPM